MLEKTLFRIDLPYRDPMEVRAFLFGATADGRRLGEPDVDPADFEQSIAFIGAMRGDEVQQTYICSRLVHKMRKIEADGEMEPGRLVMIVPCVNPASMDMGRRFWVGDGTDINRMMPGYDQGETTQRIAAGLFRGVQGFRMGVHFSSFYLRGDFLDHVRVMTGPGEGTDEGELFGLPYVLHHVPGSFDTTTLHYNWRLWDTEAYTLYTHVTDHIDDEAAAVMVRACLRFMDARGIIHRPCHGGMRATLPWRHAGDHLRRELPCACAGRPRRHLPPPRQVGGPGLGRSGDGTGQRPAHGRGRRDGRGALGRRGVLCLPPAARDREHSRLPNRPARCGRNARQPSRQLPRSRGLML